MKYSEIEKNLGAKITEGMTKGRTMKNTIIGNIPSW